MAIRVLAALLAVTLALPLNALAQARGDVWRDFIARVDVGTEMNVQLQNGQRFRATLIAVRDDAVLLQPRTRVAVPVQAIPYHEIVRMDQQRRGGGMAAGKAALIGVAAGAATFLAIVAIVFAAIDD